MTGASAQDAYRAATIGELARALRARELSSVELAQQTLSRIGEAQAALNAFITVDADRALVEARRADAALDRGDASPLTGIPVAH